MIAAARKARRAEMIMTEFIQVYGSDERRAAGKRRLAAIAVFAAACVLYAGLCVLFSLLYRLFGVSVWLCAPVNVILTVAFLWIAVLFFSVTYPPIRADVKFYKTADNALFTDLRGEFLYADAAVETDGKMFVPTVFETADGEITLYVKEGAVPTLEAGTEYFLRARGNMLFAYKAVQQ